MIFESVCLEMSQVQTITRPGGTAHWKWNQQEQKNATEQTGKTGKGAA